VSSKNIDFNENLYFISCTYFGEKRQFGNWYYVYT